MKTNDGKNIDAIVEEKENSSNGARRTRSGRTAVFNERDRMSESGRPVESENIETINKNNKTISPQTYPTTPKKRKKSLLSLRSTLSPNPFSTLNVSDESTSRTTRLRQQQHFNGSPETVDPTINQISSENSTSYRATRRTTNQLQNNNAKNDSLTIKSNEIIKSIRSQDEVDSVDTNANQKQDTKYNLNNSPIENGIAVSKNAILNTHSTNSNDGLKSNDEQIKSDKFEFKEFPNEPKSVVVPNQVMHIVESLDAVDQIQSDMLLLSNSRSKCNIENVIPFEVSENIEELIASEEKGRIDMPMDGVSGSLKLEPSLGADCNQNNILNTAGIHDSDILLPTDHNLIGILDGDVVFDLISNKEHHEQPQCTKTFESTDDLTLPAIMYNDFNNTLTNPTSPSAISVDSAKGSSVTNDPSTWVSFTTGDLFWAQIYNYCYWPCMVCPDPDGLLVNTSNFGRSQEKIQSIVHVRFFADNGRRNWVKQDNLITFNGLDSFMVLADVIKEKYGAKSAKYKLYLPKPGKKSLWLEAIKEANIIAETHYPNRLEKFYEIYEKSKNFLKLERKRRQSMYLTTTNNDIPNTNKRDRSISPFSPAYSPIKSSTIKKRKIGNDSESATNNGQLYPLDANASQDIITLFQNNEFQMLYATMREYVMGQSEDYHIERSMVTAVKNIWALKEIMEQKLEKEMLVAKDDYDLGSKVIKSFNNKNGQDTVKRLSNRLKSINSRRSLSLTPISKIHETATNATISTTIPSLAEKPKKPLNRPITEVIDDIFNLDSKYLFRGLSRDNVCKYCYKPTGELLRCSKKCLTYFHIECLHKPQIDFKKHRFIRRSKSINNFQTLNINNNNVGDESGNGEKQQFSHVSKVNGDNENVISNTLDEEQVDSEIVSVDTHVTSETDNVTCVECSNSMPALCCICQQTATDASDEIVICQMTHCTKAFHPACCKYWPQARVAKSMVRCPSHVCHTCVSDDPKGKFQNLSHTKLTKCVQCPASYHMDSTCIPAGSEILTASHIICPRHYKNKADSHVNVNWCFICVKGGQVLCCETCPISVHAQCLNIPLDPNDAYICEECESGRLPLYGEMVWAKFNSFRWWPAIILPPSEVPVNIMRKAHNKLEFVVRFFGTHDHGWISRRRVYLYVEGDCSEPPRTKSSLDQSYLRGIEEAKEIYEIIKSKKKAMSMKTDNKEKLHPQPYVKIKTNRPVPPLKLHIDMESVSKCECNPNDENPCGPDTNCLNRVLYHECNPKICPAGQNCQNQMFEKRKSPRLDVMYMKERGFGLVCREPIKAGQFIIEYVGEIINDEEFKQRMQQKTTERDENFYFLSVEKDYIIDAGPKGNLARFMNHSCDPNCETQKWLVNSLNRVGLFAIKDIPEDTELTFNYHWDELLGSEKKTCFCGAAKCAGQIGGKYKEDMKVNKNISNIKKEKKKKTVKRLQKKTLIKLQPKIHIMIGDKQKRKIVNKKIKSAHGDDAPTVNNDLTDV